MRTLGESGFTLPENPEYLDFARTDGSETTWPPNITRVVDHEGHVNFYDHIPLNHNQNIKWRVQAGEAVALKLEMQKGKNYVFRDFPDGYRLYDHNKGPQNSPRHDIYLFGPFKKRFRSPNEFIPHAIWLMGDGSKACECKYCVRKPQKEVNAALSGIIRTSSTSPSPSKRPTRDKGKGKEPLRRIHDPRQRDTRAYAAVQRRVKHLKPSPGVLKQPMLVERSNDLRAIYSNISMHLRRWFREGEVVWCALQPPIPGFNGDPQSAIEFWPGVIDEVKLKTKPIPRDVEMTTSQPQADSSTKQVDPTPQGTRGPMLENNDEPLPWTVLQSTRYKVQLLGVSHVYTIDDELVLPYQASVPSEELINAMVAVPVETLNFDKDSLAKFNPCPENKVPTFLEAVPAYAMALQIASILSSTWCLTDDYEYKYAIQPSQPSPKPTPLPPQSSSQPSRSSPPMTIQDAIERASKHNAEISNKSSYYKNVTGVSPGMSEAEVQKAANRVLGISSPNYLAQTRFQGLWWGAERIWTDDFIRLKIPRGTLAPAGGPNILAPSGPGKSAKEQWVREGRDPALIGAGTRGVFLRLDGLLTVDVPNDSGAMKKEARVCGMLYELADEDWEEPAELKSIDGTSENPVAPSSQPGENAHAANSGITLPQPPIGYKFRPILPAGHEFVGAMGLISGRYYPRILTHPKIQPRVKAALVEPIQEGAFDNLWALEGLSGGYFNSVDPHKYKKSRLVMMQDADQEALEQLQKYAQSKRESENGTATATADAMEVDEIYA